MAEPRLHLPRVVESNSDPLDPCAALAVQPQSSERDRRGEVPRRGIRAPIGLPFALPFFKPTFFAADQFGLSAFQSDRTTPQILFVDDCDGCDLSITALPPQMVIDRKVGREGTTATASSSSWHPKEGGGVRGWLLLRRRRQDTELQKFNGSLAPFKEFTTRRRAAPHLTHSAL